MRRWWIEMLSGRARFQRLTPMATAAWRTGRRISAGSETPDLRIRMRTALAIPLRSWRSYAFVPDTRGPRYIPGDDCDRRAERAPRQHIPNPIGEQGGQETGGTDER